MTGIGGAPWSLLARPIGIGRGRHGQHAAPPPVITHVKNNMPNYDTEAGLCWNNFNDMTKQIHKNRYKRTRTFRLGLFTASPRPHTTDLETKLGEIGYFRWEAGMYECTAPDVHAPRFLMCSKVQPEAAQACAPPRRRLCSVKCCASGTSRSVSASRRAANSVAGSSGPPCGNTNAGPARGGW